MALLHTELFMDPAKHRLGLGIHSLEKLDTEMVVAKSKFLCNSGLESAS